MANQTITTAVNYDAMGDLLDGETITINGGALTIDADTRWNQQAAAFGIVTLSSTLGGSVLIDGMKVWEVPFSASSGNVPTQAALGSNGVTGGTSGATGELTRVWAAGSFDPATAGAAMPAAGYIKLRSKTGNFQAGETITLPGGATIVATNAGKRGAIQVVARTIGDTSRNISVPRLASCIVDGDWYDLGTTNGADNQTFTLPVREELGGIQIETAPGSGVYEWYANAGDIWNGHYYINETLTITNGTLTRNAITAFPFPTAERLRETAVAGVHTATFAMAATSQDFPTGVMRFTARLKKDTRRWVAVQFATNGNADRFGVLVDLDAGTLAAIPNVGSPTGTASSITALSGGIYEVTLTINHTGTAGGSATIATSDSAAPTYVNGLPSFTGNVSEGVFIALSRIEMATFSFIPTDVRGKHCGVDPIAGTVQLALRGANNSGFKPPSGCKVRIPNVFLSTTQAVDDNSPMLTGQNTRYYFNPGTNPVGPTIKGAVMNWFNTGTCTVSDSCSVQFFISAFISNSCVGVGLIPRGDAALPLTNVFLASVTDSRFTRRSTGTLVLSVGQSTNVQIRRSRFEMIARLRGISSRPTGVSHLEMIRLGTSNFVFEDCQVINGNITISSGFSNGLIKNLQYADVMTGGTPAIISNAIFAQGTNMELDGFSSLGGLSNVHPYSNIIEMSYYTGLKISNIGTPTAPFDCGSANPMGNVFGGSAGSSTTMRRIYTTNNRLGVVSFSTNSSGFEMFDVWGTGSQAVDFAGANITSRGGRWWNLRRGNNLTPGTHWDDAYNTTTTGRIALMAHEPTALSASQFSATLGAGSGYTGGGAIVVSKLTDELVWTSPYKFYGHTAFAGGCSCGGTDVQNLIWEYKIDTGSGFGGTWAFLANTVRTSGNPADGATTVTMNSTDRAALTRQPQVGDFIQHSTFRLPQDTTITNIVGDVITVSNPFVSSILGATGTISFSPVNVAVSSSNGYRLQIRCRPTVAAATTLTTGFSAGIQTNATDQQIPHPLPGSLVNISNLVPQSRVKVSRVDTGAILQQASCGAGTTLAFDFQYAGAVRVEARNASGTPAYKPWFTQVSISSAVATNIVALQETDQ